MPAMVAGYVKNCIRRCFREVVDPSPSPREIDELWAFFESSCSYCGRMLDRSKQEGHIDHLLAAARSGPNHISNRVLACPDCDGDKGAQPWEPFLSAKCGDTTLFEARVAKIQGLISRTAYVVDARMVEAAEAAAARVSDHLDVEIGRLRRLQHEQAAV